METATTEDLALCVERIANKYTLTEERFIMDIDLKEKLAEIDKQIAEQHQLYSDLCNSELSLKYNWSYRSFDREEEIFAKIHELQDSKNRLITGEKPPEIVYVEKEVPKYITTKEVHVSKSGLANGFVGATLVLYVALAVAYSFGVFKVVLP